MLPVAGLSVALVFALRHNLPFLGFECFPTQHQLTLSNKYYKLPSNYITFPFQKTTEGYKLKYCNTSYPMSKSTTSPPTKKNLVQNLTRSQRTPPFFTKKQSNTVYSPHFFHSFLNKSQQMLPKPEKKTGGPSTDLQCQRSCRGGFVGHRRLPWAKASLAESGGLGS